MVIRNRNLEKLSGGYLFAEIQKRKEAFLEEKPSAELISLGIGDTTEPLPEAIVEALIEKARALGTREGYEGYGVGQGSKALREAISQRLYDSLVDPDDIFISDGSKPDIGRLQLLFGPAASIAVQDPSYPAYVDTAVIVGMTGPASETGYVGITYMPCTAENAFFPDLDNQSRTVFIFFCSPNNPTGSVATKEQLARLVDFAEGQRSIIIYDSAYAAFIQDRSLPKTIYQQDGAKRVAIETGSFSKLAGFTGLRLGWTVVPKELKFEDGSSVQEAWARVSNTFFNHASNVVQAAGLAALGDKGWASCQKLVSYYLENAQILKGALNDFEVFGGEHAPYLWLRHKKGKSSWDLFDHFLEDKELIVAPGVGFGSRGEGYIRLSAFGSRESIQAAAKRLSPVSSPT